MQSRKPRTQEAQTLRRAMDDAYGELQTAHVDYHRVLDVLRDIDAVDSAGLTLIQQGGRDYANAVTKYSTAVMDWLGFVDKVRDTRQALTTTFEKS